MGRGAPLRSVHSCETDRGARGQHPILLGALGSPSGEGAVNRRQPSVPNPLEGVGSPDRCNNRLQRLQRLKGYTDRRIGRGTGPHPHSLAAGADPGARS